MQYYSKIWTLATLSHLSVCLTWGRTWLVLWKPVCHYFRNFVWCQNWQTPSLEFEIKTKNVWLLQHVGIDQTQGFRSETALCESRWSLILQVHLYLLNQHLLYNYNSLNFLIIAHHILKQTVKKIPNQSTSCKNKHLMSVPKKEKHSII